MKKVYIAAMLCALLTSGCQANDFDKILYGINNGIEVFARFNTVRQQFSNKNEASSPKPQQSESSSKLIEIKNPDETFSYRNSKGDIVFSSLYEPLRFINGAAVIHIGKFGLVDTSGKVLAPTVYDRLYEAGENTFAGFIQSAEGVKLAYLDSKGNIIVPPMPVDIILDSGYSYDYQFYNGIALYRSPVNQKYGYIDKTGTLTIDTIYNDAKPFEEDITAVSIGGKYGYIDRKGNVVIPFKFAHAHVFSEGLAAVLDYETQKWGYIDTTGNIVIKPQFGSFEGRDCEPIAYPFINGVTVVYLGNGQVYRTTVDKNNFALIDKNGNILQRYDQIYRYRTENGQYEYFALKGEQSFILDDKGNRVEQ